MRRAPVLLEWRLDRRAQDRGWVGLHEAGVHPATASAELPASTPAAQVLLFPQQTGTTNVGSAGMAWHEVVIDRSGTTVEWFVDGLLIATIDLTTVLLGGDNILFGHSDIDATSSIDPNDAALLFTLIDDMRVTQNGAPVPAPSTLLLLGAALAATRLIQHRRERGTSARLGCACA